MIFFNIRQARDQLINAMKVYTLRLSSRATGVTMAVTGTYYGHKDIYPVKIERIKEISKPDDLLPFLDYSGFDSADEWFSAASPGARTLYLVTKYEGEV